MPDEANQEIEPQLGLIYAVRIKGHLDGQWHDWFGGLSVTLADNGETLVTGPVLDQAALHGLLRKVRDLGLALVSVNPIAPSAAQAAGDEETIEPSHAKGNS